MSWDNFKEYFVLIGISVTFITALLSLHYTRKNLKTSKYIETITTERIKWLETIRSEYSQIASKILLSLKLFKLQIEEQEEIANQSTEKNVYENFFDAETKTALNQKEILWSTSEFVQKLTLFKLRLNPIDDLNTLETLDYFINLYLNTEFSNKNNVLEAEKKINDLTLSIQKMLKDEWEKCKDETKIK
jgi:hypothetical protein